MEGPQRQLGAWLADGLGSDNAYGRADFDHLARTQITPIAQGADAMNEVTGQRTADGDFFQRRLVDDVGNFFVDEAIALDNQFSRLRVMHIIGDAAADNALSNRLTGNIIRTADGQPARSFTIPAIDNHILGDIHQTARQIASIGRPQRRIRQALARAMRRNEKLQRIQALAEMTANRQFNDAPRRIGHQAAHPRQLGNRAEAAFCRSRGRHNSNRPIRIKRILNPLLQMILGVFPFINRNLIALLFGHQAAAEVAVGAGHNVVSPLQNLVPLIRNRQITDGNGRAGNSGIVKAVVFDGINNVGRPFSANDLIAPRDQFLQVFLAHRLLHKAHFIRQDAVENRAADRANFRLVLPTALVIDIAQQDGRMKLNQTDAVQVLNFVHIDNRAPFMQIGNLQPIFQAFAAQILVHLIGIGQHAIDLACQQSLHRAVDGRFDDFGTAARIQSRPVFEYLYVRDFAELSVIVAIGTDGDADSVVAAIQDLLGAEFIGAALQGDNLNSWVHGEIIIAQHHILRRANHRRAIRGLKQILGAKHQFPRFLDGLIAQGDMNGHLVAVKIGIEGRTHQGMNLNSLAFDQQRLKGLNAQPMQSWRPIEQHRPFLDDLLQHFPDFRPFAFNDALGALDVAGIGIMHQTADNEGAIEFQRHGLGQTALMQLQLGANHNHRAPRIIDALAQQVAAETTFLAFEHVTQGFQFAPPAPTQGLAALAVVNQAVHRFLQHPLFIADNDIRRP